MNTTTTPQQAEPGLPVAFGVSHAPQIFLQPKAEDPRELARIHAGYHGIAERAEELDLDLLIVVALDHVHNHFFDLVPMFTIFTGDPVTARFNRVDVECAARPDLANSLLDHMLDNGFDPAFSHHEMLDHSFMVPLYFAVEGGLKTPVLPIIVNAYVPPQPPIKRCYDFGRQIAEWADNAGIRAGIVGTGGLSHYPGTDRFHDPDLEADRRVLEWFREGDIDRLLALSAKELDEMGMVEMRTWALALGARGNKPAAKEIIYWPNDHCGYAVVEF